MKNAIMMFILISFSYSGFWISYDIVSDVSSEDESEDLDKGAIAFGFDTTTDNTFNFGMSYDVKGGSFDNNSNEYQVFNIYSKVNFSNGKEDMKFIPWVSLGYGVPVGDLADLDIEGGLTYGFGITLGNGVGFSYSSFNGSYDASDYYGSGYEDIELQYNKFSVSYFFPK